MTVKHYARQIAWRKKLTQLRKNCITTQFFIQLGQKGKTSLKTTTEEFIDIAAQLTSSCMPGDDLVRMHAQSQCPYSSATFQQVVTLRLVQQLTTPLKKEGNDS